MENETDIQSRLVRLETNYENIDKSLDQIKNNHLAHIQAGIDTLSIKLSDTQEKYNNKIDNLRIEFTTAITALNLKDAEQTPVIKSLFDIGKYIIVAVIGALLVLVIKN